MIIRIHQFYMSYRYVTCECIYMMTLRHGNAFHISCLCEENPHSMVVFSQRASSVELDIHLLLAPKSCSTNNIVSCQLKCHDAHDINVECIQLFWLAVIECLHLFWILEFYTKYKLDDEMYISRILIQILYCHPGSVQWTNFGFFSSTFSLGYYLYVTVHNWCGTGTVE